MVRAINSKRGGGLRLTNEGGADGADAKEIVFRRKHTTQATTQRQRGQMTDKQTTKQVNESASEDQTLQQSECSIMIPEIVVIHDQELEQFYNWLQAKGDDPHAVLAMRWIAEFEVYAEQDEEDFRELKALLRSRNDAEAALVLRIATEFEETVEPYLILKRLHDWLQAMGNDPTAVRARWWLAEFEETQEEDNPSEGRSPTLH